MKKQVFLLCTLLALVACGDKAPPHVGTTPQVGPTQQMFIETAHRYDIPVRLLLAVAFMESNLTPERSSAKYRDKSHSLGISLGETAFGLSYKTLGIPVDPAKHTLRVQLEAYARLITANMTKKALVLEKNPLSLEDKFEWVWLLASIHRGGLNSRRNIQVVFALELMDILNRGHTWQNLASGEIITLPKESPPFDRENLPAHLGDRLKMFTAESDIQGVEYFELTYQKPSDGRNQPNHIRVIHCPFTLSACLEMQNPIEEADNVRMNAHYIIPQKEGLVAKSLKVAQHPQALLLTGNDGIPESVQDAIIVMLVGESGRYVEGNRTKAKPTWISKFQLSQMGLIVRRLCQMIRPEDETCLLPQKNGGIFFSHQGSSDEFQWGDIPDYDESIFWPYIQKADGLEGGLSLEFNSHSKIFQGDQEIGLKTRFSKETAKVVLQLAERCPNQKLIWTVLQNKRVHASTSANFGFTFYYQGPNGNGEQFIRAMAYNVNGELLGWAMQDLILQNFRPLEGPGANIKECQRNGS